MSAEDRYEEARRAIRAAYGLKSLARAAAPQVLGFALGTELAPALLSAAAPSVGVVVAPSDAAAAGLAPGAGEIPVWVPKAARVELWPPAMTLRLEDAQARWRKSRPFELYVNKQEERYERFTQARQRERDAAAAGAEVNSRLLDASPGRESYEVPPLVLRGEGDEPVFLTLDALVNTNVFADFIDRPYWTRVVLLAGLAERPDLLATSWRPPGAPPGAPLQKLSEEERTAALNAALRAVVPRAGRWADRLSLAVVPAAAPPRDDLLGYVPAPVPARYERSILVRVDEVDEEDPEESAAAVAQYSLDALVLLHPEDPELIGLVRAQDPAVPLVRGGFSYYVTDRSEDEKDEEVRLAPVPGDEQIPLRAYLPLRKPDLEVAVDSLAELTQRLKLSPHQRGQLRRLYPGGQLMLEGILYERCSNATTCRPAVPAGEAFAEELRARARRRPPAEILREAEERMLAEAARHQLSTDQVRRYFRRTRDRWLRAIVAALPPPVPSAAVVDESPRERAFREAYEAGLAEELRRHPDEYGYGPQHIPQVARKMTPELRAGTATLGNGARRAARALGIAPTKQAIMAWLNGGEDAAAAPRPGSARVGA